MNGVLRGAKLRYHESLKVISLMVVTIYLSHVWQRRTQCAVVINNRAGVLYFPSLLLGSGPTAVSRREGSTARTFSRAASGEHLLVVLLRSVGRARAPSREPAPEPRPAHYD